MTDRNLFIVFPKSLGTNHSAVLASAHQCPLNFPMRAIVWKVVCPRSTSYHSRLTPWRQFSLGGLSEEPSPFLFIFPEKMEAPIFLGCLPSSPLGFGYFQVACFTSRSRELVKVRTSPVFLLMRNMGMPEGSWETILKAILEFIWFGSSASVAFRIITRESGRIGESSNTIQSPRLHSR